MTRWYLRSRSMAVALFIAAAISVPAASANALSLPVTLYASPNGSGSVCTATQPCALATAQSAARGAVWSLGDITVVLGGGTYSLRQPLAFTSSDSPLLGHRVTYEARSGQVPVLSGGRRVTGWRLYSSARHIWVARVSGLQPTRVLYVNGRRAMLASAPASAVLGTLRLTSSGYTSARSWSASWGNANDQPDLVYQRTPVMSDESICGISQVQGRVITMAQPCFQNLANPGVRYATPTGQLVTPAYIENSLAVLSRPGQFYADTYRGELFYRPRAGESMSTASVIAPQLPSVVTARDVSGLTLSGLTFAYTAWVPDPAYGMVDIQSNVFPTTSGTWATMSSAASFSHVTNAMLEGNRLTHLGGAGVSFDDGGSGNLVAGNVVSDVSGTGISLADPPGSAEQNDVVTNNYVHHVANEYLGGAGIFAGDVSHTTISHNEVWAVPAMGISLGWSGSLLSKVSGNFLTTMTDNHVDYNRVHDVNESALQDGGAIYLSGTENGAPLNSSAIGNYLSGDPQPFGELYLDGGASNFKVSDNVVGHTSTNWLYVQVPKWGPAAMSNLISDNYSDTHATQCMVQSTQCPADRTIDPSNTFSGNRTNLRSWPTAALAIIARAGIQTAYRHVTGGPVDLNLAYRHPTSGSSTASGSSGPGAADDGNAATPWTSRSSWSGSWWQTDLGSAHTLSEIMVLTNLTRNLPASLSGISLVVSNYPLRYVQARRIVCVVPAPGLAFRGSIDCVAPGGRWRYVGVVSSGTRPLSLAEVRAFGH